MKINSMAASEVIGNHEAVHDLLREESITKAKTIEMDDSHEARTTAIRQLPKVTSIVGSQIPSQHQFNLNITIDNTPDGIAAVQKFMASLGQEVMTKPTKAGDKNIGSQPAIQFAPVAGGMALGLVGGVGLGIALEALRATANATGNPILGNIAIGLGLFGTALGGVAGATGKLPIVQLPGVKVAFE